MLEKSLDSTDIAVPAAPSDANLEARLAAAIDPWLQHMTWRDDFAEWRERRIWQEKHQDANVADVVQGLPRPAGKRLLDLGAGMGGLSVALTSVTGTSGACRASAAAISARSAPIRTTPRSRSAAPATRSSNVAPLARPPAIQTIRSYDPSEAAAACGLVAFESST